MTVSSKPGLLFKYKSLQLKDAIFRCYEALSVDSSCSLIITENKELEI